MPLTSEQQDEISHHRRVVTETRRVVVADLEKILYQPFDVLDHGFVRVVDYMGDETAVVQAARISYGNGSKSVRSDRALLHYLMRHGHTSPFEMCEIKLHVKLPIFVARQWIRHRTANISEISGRYSLLGAEWYTPALSYICMQDNVDTSGDRQGRSIPLASDKAADIAQSIIENTKVCYEKYRYLTDELKVARELARILLPTNIYTEWYWKVDLHNLLHFLTLRTDKHAQYEIRMYAESILGIVKRWVPLIYEAFCLYRLESVCFSAVALKVVRRLLAGEDVTQETSGLGKREWHDVIGVLYPQPKE